MKKRGFTLAELLVVLAIMSILSAILLPALRKARERALVTKCVTTIASLQVALDMYQLDYGVYPLSTWTGGGQHNGNSCDGIFDGSPNNLVNALAATTMSGPYMEFKAKDLDEETDSARPVLLDPWGQAYIYVCQKYFDVSNDIQDVPNSHGPFHPNNTASEKHKNTYNLYSFGPDRATYYVNPGNNGKNSAAANWDSSVVFNDAEDGHWQNTDVNTAAEYDDINSWDGYREK